jgi:hypothetical protein
VFVTNDKDGNESNTLYIFNNSKKWVNVHPVYGRELEYGTGALKFNPEYLVLNTDTGNLGIGTDVNPDSRLTVNGTARVIDDATFSSNAILPNLPTLGTHATNKFYIDSKFVPLSGIATVTNYIRLTAGDSVVPAVNIIQAGSAPSLQVNEVNSAAPFIISGDGASFSVGGSLQAGIAASVYGTLSAGRACANNWPVIGEDLANKTYVDYLVSLSSSGLKGYLHLNFLPLTGGVVGPVSATAIGTSPALDIRNYGTGPGLVVGGPNNNTFLRVNNNGSTETYNDITVTGNISASSMVAGSLFYATDRVGIRTAEPVATLDVRGNVNIGNPDISPNTTTGNKLTFNSSDNSDELALYRYNTSVDVTELRTQIGDNAVTSQDSFVVGALNSTSSNAWVDWLRVKYDMLSYRGVGQFSGNTQIGNGALQGLYGDGTNVAVRAYNATGGSGGIYFQTNNGATTNMYIRTSDGYVGIKTTNPTAELTVNGDINATGDIIAFTTSDERLKNNVQPITSALDKVEQISGVEYDWNTDLQSTYTGHDVGVLAQEIEKILPEAVTTREDGYKAVKYEKIVPLLIQAIKELKEQINAKS